MCYILLVLAAIFCVDCVSDDVQQGGCVTACSYVGEIVDGDNDDTTYVELFYSREYSGDLFLRTSRNIVSVGQNNLSSINNSMRSRHESHTKSLMQAVPESHAGHLTRFFEYNHFKSSLRVVYYLYALCRLRI